MQGGLNQLIYTSYNIPCGQHIVLFGRHTPVSLQKNSPKRQHVSLTRIQNLSLQSFFPSGQLLQEFEILISSTLWQCDKKIDSYAYVG